MSDRIGIAQVVSSHAGNQIRSQGVVNSNNASQTFDAVNTTRQTLYQRENLHMQFGGQMASRYNETLLFKLFTKSFTANDEILIKKILGRDTATALNVNDLNQVADFLFVKDTSGNIMGLSEAFFSLINGLGYVHNK